MTRNPAAGAGIVTVLVLALTGCFGAAGDAPADTAAASPEAVAATPGTASTPGAASTPSPTPTAKTPTPTPKPTPTPTPSHTPSATPDRAPTRASIAIPAIGVQDLRVIPYTGTPDDAPGTRIQNRGVAASPHGPEGGVGPGEIGNYIVTAHRNSAGGPFLEVPSLRKGDHILVTARGRVYDYEVRRTMTISFRSERSKARQTAEVPGHPGKEATRPMITLSTCATQEDHARGNYWSDEFGNPEHRIDKVGVLVDVRPA